MIHYKELRCGNLVYNPTLKEIKTIDYLDLRDMAEGMLWNPFKSIELTDEWLLKLGFEKTKEITWSFGYEKEYKVYRRDGLTYNEIQACWWYHAILENQPIYVHQLQNLYFALTGKEL